MRICGLTMSAGVLLTTRIYTLLATLLQLFLMKFIWVLNHVQKDRFWRFCLYSLYICDSRECSGNDDNDDGNLPYLTVYSAIR